MNPGQRRLGRRRGRRQLGVSAVGGSLASALNIEARE